MLYIKADDEISEFDGQEVLIFPLKQDELELLNESKENFSAYINLNFEALEISKETFQILFNKIKENPNNWVFHTLWVVVSIQKRAIVGLIYFKSFTSDGEVEIEFSTGEKHQNEGYATTAVSLLCNFSKNVNISKIKAKTQKNNVFAIKILKNNGFFEKIEQNNQIYWEKEVL